MSEPSNELQNVESQAPAKVNKRPGFHNQGNIKAAARGIVLEALTAWKGEKVGKRGLLVKAMAELDKALESGDIGIRHWAVENVLKMANGMAKDDKAGQSLADMLGQGAKLSISFHQHFEERASLDQPGKRIEIGHAKPDQSEA